MATSLRTFLDNRSFDYRRTVGASTLSAAGDLSVAGIGKEITLSPFPRGLKANMTCYITGGTGASETTTITDVNGTAGSNTGTIIATTSNAHLGAWSIQSATSGIQEAVNIAETYDGGVVLIAVDSEIRDTVVISGSNIKIRGMGRADTVVSCSVPTIDLFHFNGSSQEQWNEISNMQISCSGKTAGWAIRLDNQFGLDICDFSIVGSANGIVSNNSSVVRISDGDIRSLLSSAGVGVRITGDGLTSNENYIGRLVIDNSAVAQPAAGIHLINCGGVLIDNASVVHSNNGLLIDPQSSQSVHWLFAMNSAFDSGSGHGIAIQPSGTGVVKSLTFTGCWTATNELTGVFISLLDSATVNGVQFIGHRSVNNVQHGFHLNPGPINTAFDNCKAAGNSRNTVNTYHGVFVEAGASRWSVMGGIYGQCDGFINSQNTGILINAGASDNYTIIGANTTGNLVGNIADGGTGTSKVIKGNNGPSTQIPTIASSATISLPASDVIAITGTTTITTINGGYIGRRISLLFNDVAPGGVGTGGNISRAQAAVTFQRIDLVFDGANWF